MHIVTFIRLTLDSDVYLFGYASEEAGQYNHIPSLTSARVKPAIIEPGVSIGQRESVTVSLIDHLYRFDTDDFNAGTFWTKFRARYASIEGAQLELIRGEQGQDIADMDVYLYIAQSLQISRTGATIVAKDPLILLTARSAQAPNITEGELAASISDVDGSLTLSPAGIGNLQYPASGKAVIGGAEIVSFTRSGDNVTLTTRGENRDAQSHDEGAKFQLALVYENELPSAIVFDLLSNYTEIDPAWITLEDWQQSVDVFIDRVYGAEIPVPTSVSKLLDELCEQVGLVFFWDALAQQIRLRPLLAAAPTRLLTVDQMTEGSFTATEQPDKRVSQVWTFYGQRDPVLNLTDTENYRRVAVALASNQADFIQPAIKKIFSRWINFPARTTAERLNDIILSRYQLPPRKFSFQLFRSGEEFQLPALGAQLNLQHWFLVDADGAQVTVAAQATSAAHDDAHITYAAEEARFAGEDPTLEDAEYKYVFIDGDQFNINLRDQYDQIYTTPNDYDQIIFVISAGARVGGAIPVGSQDVPSLDVGDWPEMVELTLINDGRIQGIGGGGGGSGAVTTQQDGLPGGTAIYTRRIINVENNGLIYGGAGGGAARINVNINVFFNSAGGGGAGFLAGGAGGYVEPKSPVASGGTQDAGGNGQVDGGAGGNPGQPGNNSSSNTGGAAGPAVDGDSFITLTGAGTLVGPTIN